jgi:type I restriction enzyme S subunit
MIKTGSIQMKINQENMNGITVPNIPDVLKEKINLELCTIEKKQLQIIAENCELASLRAFLLPMLMNGQVGFK